MESEVDLTTYLDIFKRRGWAVIAAALIAALTAGLLSMFVITPVYSSSTTLMVIKKEAPVADYTTLMLNRNLTRTYGEIARSRTVAEQVIRDLKLGISAEDLLKKISVNPVRETEIIQIKVKDPSPQLAQQIAAQTAQAFIARVQAIMKVENVEVIDPAAEPTKPDSPRPLLNTAVGMVLGLMMGTGLVFVLEYLDSSIKTPEDVERYLGLPVLGTIPVVNGGAGRRHRSRAY